MPSIRRFRITINGKVYEVEAEEIVEPSGMPRADAPPDPNPMLVPKAPSARAGSATVLAPLPGLVLDVKVSLGDHVEAGQTLVILEAMKMENEVGASKTGVVREVHVVKGDNVSAGDVLLVLE